MGEVAQEKPEEKKVVEKKPEEAGKTEETEKVKEPDQKTDEEKKDGKISEEAKQEKESKEETPAPPPPPPQEIVLKVFMHCEGCARKVRRSLKGFEGIEDVITDCKNQKVIVKGEKADPLKVLERVQRKSHRRVQLLSPIPKPPVEEEKKPEEPPKPEENKIEAQPILVVLKVHMHCEACAQELKKRIMRMEGVESAEADLKNSEVSVKGVFEPSHLVKYVYKRTGKHAVMVKQEPEKTEKGEESKESKEEEGKKAEEIEDKDKKDDGGGDGDVKDSKNKEAVGESKPEDSATHAEETKMVETKKNEFMYHYPDYYSVRFMDSISDQSPPLPPPPRNLYPGYYPPILPHPPQMFSDENPNACSVM